MAVSFPKPGLAAALLALLLPMAAAALLPESREPISLDAESSEYDREAGRLTFEAIRVVQGALSITADRAVANELDFGDSTWEFMGDVTISGQGSRIRSDRATLLFVDHRLARATATGSPATFAREATESLRALSGGAGTIDYDARQDTIRLTGSAFLVDGANRIQGEQLLYQLQQERLVATSDKTGEQRVQITIKPPAEESGPAEGGDAGEEAGAPPAPATGPDEEPEPDEEPGDDTGAP